MELDDAEVSCLRLHINLTFQVQLTGPSTIVYYVPFLAAQVVLVFIVIPVGTSFGWYRSVNICFDRRVNNNSLTAVSQLENEKESAE